MREFPSVEADEFVTKSFLRAELATLETRLTVRIGAAIGASTASMIAAMTLLR